MRVGIRVDAGPRIGGGHVMRCLTLAAELSAAGAEVNFAAAALPAALSRRIIEAGHGVSSLPKWPNWDRERTDWHEPPLDAAAQQQDAEATGKACGAVDWMIVDHYLLDHHWHSQARRFAERVLVIDDLANRSYDCDLLLDQTLGRSVADYNGLVSHCATVLTGAHCALLRPEFRGERAAAFKRRRELKPAGRILVSLGTTDLESITAKVVDAVVEAVPSCALDVVLADGAASLRHVQEVARRHSGIAVHIDSDNMAELMRDADLAIGAAGTSSWERCCLGLPTIILVLAENQRPTADALVLAGAAITSDDAAELGGIIAAVVNDAPLLQRMSAAAFTVTDGEGVSRIRQAIAGPTTAEQHSVTIELREATADDSDLLWLWRNDPVTRFNSCTTDPIGWADHVRWLSAILRDENRELLIAERGGRPVGMIRFDAVRGEPGLHEVSINVRPDVRGKGVGRTMLSSACDRLFRRHECRILASVREANQGSRRLFESCGFRFEGAQGGWARYVLGGQHRSADPKRKLA